LFHQVYVACVRSPLKINVVNVVSFDFLGVL
jgi:hypothetical protein